MESILEYMRRRAASTLVVSYGVFWLIYHWQGVYTTLFVNQDLILGKYNMLKNEYVDKYFFGFDWTNIWSISNLNVLLGWIIPAALAYLYVWWLPRWFINPAYKHEVRYKTDRKIAKLDEEKRISIRETAAIEKKAEAVDAEIDLAKKKATAIRQDPTIAWRDEYEQFIQSSGASHALEDLQECIYHHNGFMEVHDFDEQYSLSAHSRMFADTWGLAEIDQNSISLTDKGRFFMREYRGRSRDDV